VLTLPEGSDPADFVSQHGRGELERLVKEAPDALDHKLARMTRGVDLTRDTHAVATAVDTLLKIVANAPDGLRIDQLLNRMSRRFEFKPERLERRLQFFRDEAERRSGARRSIHDARPRVRNQRSSIDPNAAFAESAELDTAVCSGLPAGTADGGSGTQADLRPLTGIDRDLFETLIENPDLAATAVEAIDPEWFETTTAKMLLSAYQDLDLAGRRLEIDAVLSLVENASLKNQIVTLQERLREREGQFPQSPEQRYASIMMRYRERAFSVEQSKQIEKLASAELAEDEEVALLRSLINQERQRHGIKHEP
jgi:DNA primase